MRKWLHNLLKGASLTTALFIFQACYGTPYDYDFQTETLIFNVKDAETGEPITGVNLQMRFPQNGGNEWREVGTTDADGKVCSHLTFRIESIPVPEYRFEHQTNAYQVKDTVITDITTRPIDILLKSNN